MNNINKEQLINDLNNIRKNLNDKDPSTKALREAIDAQLAEDAAQKEKKEREAHCHKVIEICKTAAEEMGITAEKFMRDVHDIVQRENDRLAVFWWMQRMNNFSEKLLTEILDVLPRATDPERNLWDNIEAAYLIVCQKG